MRTSRRRFLATCGLSGLGALAGCTDTSADTPPTWFGTAVAVAGDGTTVLVSDVTGDDVTAELGSVHVFTTVDGSWTQTATLTPNGHWNGRFGQSIALSSDGTTALVGAGDPHNAVRGSAFVFDTAGDTWRQQALRYGDTLGGFGYDVALSGDGTTAVISAPWAETANEYGSGAVYVYAEADGNWTRQAKLTASDGREGVHFGESVAVSTDGATVLVGSRGSLDSRGSAHVFGDDDGSWRQQATLTADDSAEWDGFGHAVALSGDGTTALVGAPFAANDIGDAAGSVFVFDIASGTVTQRAVLVPGLSGVNNEFGNAVAVSNDGTTAIVGDLLDGHPREFRSGSAYVWSNTGGPWTQEVYFGRRESHQRFGRSVAITADGRTTVVGAPFGYPSREHRDSAFVYDASDDGWLSQVRLTREGVFPASEQSAGGYN